MAAESYPKGRKKADTVITLSDKRLLDMEEFSIYASVGICTARALAKTACSIFSDFLHMPPPVLFTPILFVQVLSYSKFFSSGAIKKGSFFPSAPVCIKRRAVFQALPADSIAYIFLVSILA